MMGVALVRPLRSVAWELRALWATGRRVSVTIDSCDCERLEGVVRAVAATDAYAVVGGWHVPLERVLAVHRPSRLGDSTVGDRERWAGPIPHAARHDPRQLRFDA